MPNEITLDWILDRQLEHDTIAVGDLPLCQVRLMNDDNYPWLLLVPRRANATEVTDLADADQAQLTREIAQAGSALKAETKCDKINIGAIGNIVPQLHVHVVARFRHDTAWPKPVWGFALARAYDKTKSQQMVDAFRRRLAIAC